ncbi:serine/threonine-protein kinase csk1 [Echria macrotheca]|uniref:cyclin-dependent kinase n=1 Tax=Echria macrotheca TaxID=438768 RepID=A0AAJ0B186_9PEZI|nr:serine/threonine-protein kinase csk1 [Echria macrotheca]
MSDQSNWRDSLTALERYDNIQKITAKAATAGVKISAFDVENEAYKLSESRAEYDAACSAEIAGSATDGSGAVPADLSPEAGAGPAVRVGPYEDCYYVASGVTAEVYRYRDRALKVIVETRDIEPHNPAREAKILQLLKKPCIPLLETFFDQEGRFVLAFPYMPLTLGTVLDRGAAIPDSLIRKLFVDIFTALEYIHERGIIHRDIKPSAILLASPTGPAYLSDFGTAWHPALSSASEPPDNKILDIGTGPYRAPEVLFGNKSYGTAVDMWGAGTMLTECCRRPVPKPLFESRPVHEDGNQLGLILSIFKTIGSPTRETWPEAANFKTPPFDMYRTFERRDWDVVLPEVSQSWRDLIAALVRYDSGRITAGEALKYPCLCE